MTLHSQQIFSVRNEDKGRGNPAPVTESQRYTAEETRAMEDLLIAGVTPKKAEAGRPSKFEKYRALFEKHGELTANDVDAKLNANLTLHAIRNNLTYFWVKGLLDRERLHNVYVYRLAGVKV